VERRAPADERWDISTSLFRNTYRISAGAGRLL